MPSKTFLTAAATRSWIANVLGNKEDGRSGACDESGFVVSVKNRQRQLPYSDFANIRLVHGLIWSSLTVLSTTGEAITASWLPKDDAKVLGHALDFNYRLNVRRIAAKLATVLDQADLEVNQLAAGGRYLAAHMVRPLLALGRRLAPLLQLRIKPGILPPDVVTKVRRVAEFLKHINDRRAYLNDQFVEAELLAVASFLDTVEAKPLRSAQRRAVVINEDCNLVVAAAGSGKTSVIVAKVAYLLHRKLRAPNEILMMAFGKHARKEMADRLRKRDCAEVTVKTFHGLGKAIITKVEGRPPPLSPMAEDDKALVIFLRSAIEHLNSNDREFAEVFLGWFQSHFAPYQSHWDFETYGEYWQYIRDYDIRTLKGEKVKSYEECEIANWLYLNGIDYQYEPYYEHDVSTPERRQYKPDFYLPEFGIYIEHFAVDAKWRTPPFIDQAEYLDGIKWKRNTHEHYRTVLVETYSHEKRSGTLLTGLLAKLKDKSNDNLEIKPVSVEDALSRLADLGRVDDFSKLTATFLRHFKGSQASMEEIAQRAAAAPDRNRSEAFLNVFSPVFNAYRDHLNARGEIDFEDMIARATEYVGSGRFTSPFGYILVDEYQDISVGRAKLLKALLSQRYSNQLFAVGDDWQAIFRFAGSDVSLMQHFADHFGITARTDLEETFRCVDRISDVASQFVQRNGGQLRKDVTAVNKAAATSVFIGRQSGNPNDDILNDALTRIVKHAGGQKAGVLLLGRYNSCEPKDLTDIQNAFPSLKLRFRSAHGSKGLEDDYVVVLDLQSGRKGFPTGIVDDPLLDIVLPAAENFPHAEERRLFYVALTRARRAVFLLVDRNSPSPFVLELERDGYDVTVFGGDTKTIERCPACKEGELIIRIGTNGPFASCSYHPLCEHTEDICPTCKTGIVRRNRDRFVCLNPECRDERRLCPKCRRGWMRQKNRRTDGRPFLSCSEYPACGHTESVV